MPRDKHDVYSQELYQRVYDQNPRYGCAATGSCPGVRLMPHYQDWLIPPILDFGCGTGETVSALIERGLDAQGIDWITPREGLGTSDHVRQGDITKPLDVGQCESGVCIDVIEHIDQPGVLGLLRNMAKLQRQAISINNASSINNVDGQRVELHINRRPFDEWEDILGKHLSIVETLALHENQRLYLCQHK